MELHNIKELLISYVIASKNEAKDKQRLKKSLKIENQRLKNVLTTR